MHIIYITIYRQNDAMLNSQILTEQLSVVSSLITNFAFKLFTTQLRKTMDYRVIEKNSNQMNTVLFIDQIPGKIWWIFDLSTRFQFAYAPVFFRKDIFISNFCK